MPDRITKFINSLDAKLRKRLKERLLELKSSPFAMHDVKKMQGVHGDVYRLRFGEIRIIYRVVTGIVEILDIDYRGNIY